MTNENSMLQAVSPHRSLYLCNNSAIYKCGTAILLKLDCTENPGPYNPMKAPIISLCLLLILVGQSCLAYQHHIGGRGHYAHYDESPEDYWRDGWDDDESDDEDDDFNSPVGF